VVEAATLADFDLLRDTWQDIWQFKWAQPAHREGMNLHFRVKRAKEEPKRLNVELQRLLTFMLDEHVDFYHAIASQIIVNPPLALELQKCWEFRQEINANIMVRLV
jgi:hypothetical protein